MKETIICANCGYRAPTRYHVPSRGETGFAKIALMLAMSAVTTGGRILRRDNAYWGNTVNAICNGAYNFC